MYTGRIRIRVPGIFAPIETDTPSSGCTVRMIWFCWTPTEPAALERHVRDRLQRDRDLGHLAGQALAGAQVERNPGPAPVGHVQAQRRVGLGARVRRDPRPPRGSPGRACRRRLPARTGLGPPSPGPRRSRGGTIASSTLTFSSRTPVGLERDRRLHRQQREQLEHVVLDEVAQRARVVVVAGPPLDPDVLGRGDLARGRCSSGSRRARTACSRTGTPSGSGPSPCRGSGRSGRSATRRTPRSSSAFSSRAEARS